jgi:glycosyltransferase involved in cell wall biosynthesis
MQTVFYVSSIFSAKIASSAHATQSILGRTNYSYAIAMGKFVEALNGAGCSVIELTFPHILQGPIPSNNENRCVHLAFYPPDELRLLKHATNILMFAWEFSTLRTDDMLFSSHAFGSHVRMLETVDAVWTPSFYAANVIRRSCKLPVNVIPAPMRCSPRNRDDTEGGRSRRKADSLKVLHELEVVPLCIFPRHQTEASAHAFADKGFLLDRINSVTVFDKVVVYLTVLNPHDARKGLKESLEAFCRFSQERDGALWIIKTASYSDSLETINTRLLTHQIAREGDMVGQYFSDRILVCNTSLSDDEMSALYDLSDFYLCTSQAEGQNFPLQEAMAQGVVPVSVRHTAMADYITPENAVVLESEEQTLPPSIARKYGLCGAKWFYINPCEVFRGLKRSFDLTPQEYREMSVGAAGTISERFSGSVVMAKISDALR